MTLSGDFFEEMYAGGDDPWGFRDRWYEERKRALTLAVLPRGHFGAAFEPGCSNGELTAGLAGRCERLLGCDVSAEAVTAARRRTRGLPGVELVVGDARSVEPPSPLDLLVLSEVAYYFAADDLSPWLRDLARCLSPTAVVVACHWRHPVADYPLRGDLAQDLIAEALSAAGLHLLGEYVDDDLRLGCWDRSGRSVATVEGLVGGSP